MSLGTGELGAWRSAFLMSSPCDLSIEPGERFALGGSFRSGSRQHPQSVVGPRPSVLPQTRRTAVPRSGSASRALAPSIGKAGREDVSAVALGSVLREGLLWEPLVK